MTEVQEAIKFEKLSKFEHRYDDYDMVVEINREEHNLDFLIDHLRNKIIFFYDYGDGDDLDDCKKEIKKLKKENSTLKLLVQNWEQLDDEKDEQLEKMNDSLKRFVEENNQLQQELFESEQECIEVHYYDNPIRRDNKIEMLKEEFKERFGRDFE